MPIKKISILFQKQDLTSPVYVSTNTLKLEQMKTIDYKINSEMCIQIEEHIQESKIRTWRENHRAQNKNQTLRYSTLVLAIKNSSISSTNLGIDIRSGGNTGNRNRKSNKE